MALDELNREIDNHIVDNEIDIIYDNRIKSVIANTPKMVIDYRKSFFGEGFFIDNGGRC